MSYNGYPNRATWVTNLYLDEYFYKSCKESGIRDSEKIELLLREIVQDMFEGKATGFVNEILNDSYRQIDFEFLAKNLEEILKNE